MRFLDINRNKSIIFLLVYVFVVIAFVYFYLIPVLDSYKIANSKYERITHIESELKELDNKTSALESNKNISNLRNMLTINDIKDYANKFFQNVKVQEDGISDMKDSLKSTNIKIFADTKDTNSIIAFITNLNMLKASVRASFPLIITKKDKILSLEISLIIYNSTYNLQ